MPKGRILIIDDDPNVLDLTQFHLRKKGFETASSQSGEEGLALLANHEFDVALSDLRLPDVDGIALVAKIKETSPDTEIIVISGFGTITKALEAAEAGAFYFLEKPVNYEELLLLIDKAIERCEQSREIKSLRGKLSTPSSYDDIIGSSRAIQNIYEIIDSVAESDANVLIIGESGTGKELVANAVHYKSLRAKKPFVKINCAALPKELIESELFGHTKGSFTGAIKDKMGLIGQANGGSLLMDEIGEMPLELQPKLLRVLQERVYTPVGSGKPLEADFRLICATNRNPFEAIKQGTLREDLYYRINTIEIHVPPLREREEDVQKLAEHFVKVFSAKYERPAVKISRDAYAKLFRHSWPGNVRELQNVIERAVLMAKGDTIDGDSLPLGKPAPGDSTMDITPAERASPVANDAANDAADNHQRPAPLNSDLEFDELCRLLVKKLPPPGLEHIQYNIFELLEGGLAKAALERTRGNKQAAANLLGLYRPRLYSIIKKHNLLETTAATE